MGAKASGEILALYGYFVIAAVQHVCYLGVLLEALARRRRYDVLSLGICVNDIRYLAELLCVGERAPAELYNLAHSVDPFLCDFI